MRNDLPNHIQKSLFTKSYEFEWEKVIHLLFFFVFIRLNFRKTFVVQGIDNFGKAWTICHMLWTNSVDCRNNSLMDFMRFYLINYILMVFRFCNQPLFQRNQTFRIFISMEVLKTFKVAKRKSTKNFFLFRGKIFEIPKTSIFWKMFLLDRIVGCSFFCLFLKFFFSFWFCLLKQKPSLVSSRYYFVLLLFVTMAATLLCSIPNNDVPLSCFSDFFASFFVS